MNVYERGKLHKPSCILMILCKKTFFIRMRLEIVEFSCNIAP
jgi:hypothetical protein